MTAAKKRRSKARPRAAQTQEALRSRLARLELLYQVSQVIHSTLEPQEALDLIVREAVRVMRASSGSVVLINPVTGLLEIQAVQGLPPEAGRLYLRVGEGITGWVAQHGVPARVGDVLQDKRYVPLRQGVRSEMAVPLRVGDEVRGVLNVDADRLDAFSEEDQALLEELAAQAAHVIRNTWLYEQARLKAHLLETLVSVSRSINSPLSLHETLQVVTQEAVRLMKARMAALMLLDDTRQWLRLEAHCGAGPAYVQKPPLPVNDSLLGSVIRRKKPLQVENVQTSSGYQHVDVARQEGLVALLSVPLLFRGEAVGTLSVYTDHPYRFSNEEIGILSALADLSATAIEKARLHERIVDMEEMLRQNEKLSAIGLLAAEIAHEIRNPLTVMKMLYHSLDLKFPPEDPRAEDARIMGEKIDLLNRIVEQILDFARSSEPQMAPVKVNTVISDLLLLIRPKLQQHKIELVTDLASHLPQVMADAAQLEQAMLNLALNAIEAMPDGGQLCLRTERITRPTGGPPALAEPASGEVLIEVRDTGPGMTEQQRQRAFRSLLRSTKPRGTGLGLALVKRVIEAHRGTVELHSALGRGTSVLIRLPAVSPQPQPPSQPTP